MAKIQKVEKIWFDGKMVNWEEAKVHILTHTLHYGLGVFEGIRAYECADGTTAIFRLTDHIDRLFDSAHAMTLEIPHNKGSIIQACKDVMRVNKLAHGYLRPIAFLGYGEMGLYAQGNPVQTAVIAWPWGTYLGEEGLKKGIRAKISSMARSHVNVLLTKTKTVGNYVNSILAKREALAAKYDEAILLNTSGHVCEATGENIFIVKNGEVRTPNPGSAILKGITRDAVMQILKDEGISCREDVLTRDDLYIADECFLTGTAAEITPVREVDDRSIGAARPGPITQKVQSIFFDIVKGKNKKYRKWLEVI